MTQAPHRGAESIVAEWQAQQTAEIDWRSVEWGRVRRVQCEVRHHYRYAYQHPIARLEQRLIMTPPDRHVDQVLLQHALDVTGGSPDTRVEWEWDRFGNRVAHVYAPRVDEEIKFEAAYRVERVARRPGSVLDMPERELRLFAAATALTAPDERLRQVAAQIRRDGPEDDLSLAERAHVWASAALTYQVGMTGVRTPAAMALHLGSGVCQDFAHILLAVLRLLGVPARYASGHLLGEGVPHAWVEVLARHPEGAQDEAEVVAFDPTNRRRAGTQYVTVAVGRDFADVSPTSGSFAGSAQGAMTWGKRAAVVEVEYAT